MRRYCECGRKVVVKRSKGRPGFKQGKDDHDLCQQCYKRDRDMRWIVPEMRRITPR